MNGRAAHRYLWGGGLRRHLAVVYGVMFFIASAAVLAVSLILVINSMRYSLDLAFADGYRSNHASDNATKSVIIASMWRNLLLKGSIAVLCIGVVATTVGWLVAGRLLRPLRLISSTAERIAGRNLHQRIDLAAPPGEVKTLADSFDRMLDRLDQAFAGQERFIANAAHELKTPIAVNRTLVEVAMNRPGAPAEVLALGDNLLAVNVRHERLIDSLLTLARAQNSLVEQLPLDLADLVHAVVEAARPEACRHHVRLEAVLAPTAVSGDPVLLEQAVRNLVDNAIRYNEDGGLVRVETGRGTDGAQVTVANTGPTISEHEVPVLFAPFRRLTDRVGSARGSGLGLSIVRAVAEAHGGSADALPRPGGGLSVRIVVPAATAPAPLPQA
ncbi:ATP-binding protein [Streptomyces sp. NPDC020362]|uniref:HAMP domain-containing sensor histidine kinase n=1 Tax=unclassified Streptomyces TaxID=2593676 RepID=UPI0033C8124E